MLKIIIPVILMVLGAGVGGAAGFYLRPVTTDTAEAAPAAVTAKPEYVKLPNQFVIPLLERGKVTSIVVLSLSIEVPEGGAEGVLTREPRLRDDILRILFDHANNGGFRGTFTESGNMNAIRQALLESARKIIGPEVSDVLITDIARQDT